MVRWLRVWKQGKIGLGAALVMFAGPACMVAAEQVAPQTAVVPFERGKTGFAPGDMITVTQVHGDRAAIEVGGSYEVEGTWKLQSQPEALLALWSTDGETEGMTPMRVMRGEGHFAFKLRVLKEGNLHVSYYPANGGNSFGGTYFGTGQNVYRGSYVPGPPTSQAPASVPPAASAHGAGP